MRACPIAVVLLLTAAIPAFSGERFVVSRGHSGRVTCADLHSEGRLVLTGGRDGTARLWSDGRLVRVLEGHRGGVTAVALFPDARRAVTGGLDGTARIWDLVTGRERFRLEGHETRVLVRLGGNDWPESGRISAVDVSPDGATVLTTANDGTGRLWDAATGRAIRVLQRHASRVAHGRVVSGGRRVLTAGEDGTARLWETATGREVRRFTLHRAEGTERYLRCAAISGDERWVATGAADGTIWLWEADTGRALLRLAGHRDAVEALAFDRDGEELVSGAADGELRRWETASGNALSAAPGGRVVLVDPLARHVVEALEDGTVEIRRARDRRSVVSLPGASPGLAVVSVSPDGSNVVAGRDDGKIRAWSAEGPPAVGDGSTDAPLISVRHGPAGRVATLDADGAVAILSRDENGAWRGGRLPCRRCSAIAISPDGSLLAAGNVVGTLRLWDVESGSLLPRLLPTAPPRRPVAAVRFLSGEARLLVAHDRLVRLLTLEEGREELRLEGHFDRVVALGADGAGRTILSTSRDGTARIWDVATGRQVGRLEVGGAPLVGAAMSADGTRVLAGAEDATLRTWERATGRELARWRLPRSPVDVAASSDGQVVAAVDGGPIVRLWLRGAGPVRLTDLGEDGWAVVAPDGRYDASGPAAISRLSRVTADGAVRSLEERGGTRVEGLLGKLLEESAPGR
jgi:WD40 repeat protein